MTLNEFIGCLAREGRDQAIPASAPPIVGSGLPTGNPEDFDLVHEAYLELSKTRMGAEQFERALRFRAKRRGVDQGRKNSRWQRIGDFTTIPDSHDPTKDLERKELASLVHESLGVLTSKQQRVIDLICFQHRTQRDAARALGCTPQAVHACYHKALGDLRRHPLIQSFSPDG